ncbi:STAS domain-containing protein [Thauera butanivorans]|uniref:STAS domain-containing protein n=1 Tax=Thauera butanivorans TaxID=86174 RepID=UPI0008382B07|nr:STAS domain-containing protein [Thauera butanivorans]
MALSFFGRKRPGGERQTGPAEDVGETGRPSPTVLSELDFTGTGADHGLSMAVGGVEVQEVGAGIGAVFEEAAILYANGGVAEAEQVLTATLDDPKAATGEGLWMMLLDLYRLTGQRERFEARVLDYAMRFERSPPPWVDLSPKGGRTSGERMPAVGLSGNLAAQGETQLAQIAAVARRSGAVRIDVGRLRNVADAGCSALLTLLESLLAERIKLSLSSVEPFIEDLARRTVAGQAEGRDTWLLLLELLQFTGDQQRFENLAIDYAVTFEESPPSWKGIAAAVPKCAEPEADAVAGDVPRLCGELCGAANESLKRLASLAAERRELKVDCAQLHRVDFVCAGLLFNILATLKAQGKLVTLFNVNAMVAALLRVMSVDQVAHVTLRH